MYKPQKSECTCGSEAAFFSLSCDLRRPVACDHHSLSPSVHRGQEYGPPDISLLASQSQLKLLIDQHAGAPDDFSSHALGTYGSLQCISSVYKAVVFVPQISPGSGNGCRWAAGPTGQRVSVRSLVIGEEDVMLLPSLLPAYNSNS